MKIVISESAKEDLYNISDYLAEHSPAATKKLLKKFRNKFSLLATFPMLGRERNDIVIGMRCLVMDEYLIFYQPHDTEVEIWHIRHSAQDSTDFLPHV
jgi:toxin ParE1/3/4